MSQFKSYYKAVDYLETLASSKHDQAYMHNRNNNPQQYVDRTRELIKLLGNPHRGFKYIHISGTSGKGTTTTLLHNILHKAGYKVGSFTSPYATTSIEKIRVDDKLIDALVFASLVNKVKTTIQKMEKNYKYGRPSYFEIFFAISILYFKKMKCDYVILEVGCGGTYDAGMIIPNAITATTNIGLDHTQLLGNTLTKIANEKAGIIRKNSHHFTTEKRPNLLKLFKSICKIKNTQFRHITYNNYDDPNTKIATAIAKHLKINNKIIKNAIANTTLPCRFEIIQKKPLVILDGAHNPMKIKNVVHNLKNLTYDRLYTIFASGTNKDAQKMIKILAKVSNEIVFTSVNGSGRDFYKAQELAKLAKEYKKKRIDTNPKHALKSALKKIKPNDCLLITGSFYLAGELRKKWISENNILKNRTHVKPRNRRIPN